MSARHPSNIRDFITAQIAYGGAGLVVWLLLSWLLAVVPLIGPNESLRSPFSVPGFLAMEFNILWVILVTGTLAGCAIAILLQIGGTLRRLGFDSFGAFLGDKAPYLVSIGAGLYQAYILFPPYAPKWALFVCGLIPGIAFPKLLVRIAAPIRRGWEN